MDTKFSFRFDGNLMEWTRKPVFLVAALGIIPDELADIDFSRMHIPDYSFQEVPELDSELYCFYDINRLVDMSVVRDRFGLAEINAVGVNRRDCKQTLEDVARVSGFQILAPSRTYLPSFSMQLEELDEQYADCQKVVRKKKFNFKVFFASQQYASFLANDLGLSREEASLRFMKVFGQLYLRADS